MKLEIFMKSGNVIHLDRVQDWKVSVTGNVITELMIVYHKWFSPRRLIMESIDLSQIEAVVKEK